MSRQAKKKPSQIISCTWTRHGSILRVIYSCLVVLVHIVRSLLTNSTSPCLGSASLTQTAYSNTCWYAYGQGFGLNPINQVHFPRQRKEPQRLQTVSQIPVVMDFHSSVSHQVVVISLYHNIHWTKQCGRQNMPFLAKFRQEKAIPITGDLQDYVSL